MLAMLYTDKINKREQRSKNAAPQHLITGPNPNKLRMKNTKGGRLKTMKYKNKIKSPRTPSRNAMYLAK